MRSINSNIISALESNEIIPFYLLDIEIENIHYRYTDCDVPIMENNSKYVSKGFKVDNIIYSLSKIVSDMRLEIDDIDETLKALFVGGTPRGETILYKLILLSKEYEGESSIQAGDALLLESGSGALLLESASGGVLLGGPYQEYYDTIGILTLMEGFIDNWELDESKIEIKVASLATQWNQQPLTKQSPLCRWKEFGGTECGYSGEQTECDRTYTKCVEYENTANFGGERWLSSLVDKKEFWWGYVPETK